ncbi:EamA family transporter [Providencia stuartii]|uniref:Membrane protein n=1 Tax=Providencia stuartii ATCC 25827 TaxID=471874 RepID=A0AA86YNA1_PROST|nr:MULTISPECIES: EamA family transporter [Providencia]EDU60883.1 putative membrane protein [Providencia stuartii ATCC 25827]EMD1716929.1 EamA family transporter [Providencia stuartii]MBG5907575.1 EamA family transporter [Providencia stuartii]MBS7781810.1 EamA family transporter [Providencia thailandensis]MTC82895.1 EamA family transporter [Providencia stuartii]
MSFKDILLALCVVIIWGVNFVIIKLGVTALPPLLLGALRFIFVAFPAIFFFKRPKIPFKLLLLYGLTISFGQFAFLFCAIRVGMPAGVTSVILQSQAFFTLLLGAVILKESLQATHFIGMLIAVVGLTILAKGATASGLDDIPLLGLTFTLIAGLSWACGNITNRMIMHNQQEEKCSALSLVSWSALIPIIPFLISSWLFEGEEAIVQGLSDFNWPVFGTIIYLAYLSTFVGYGLWGVLLGRYEAWRVAPFSLLVPVFGLSSSALFLDEHINSIQFAGLILIMFGLIITLFGKKLIQRIRSH